MIDREQNYFDSDDIRDEDGEQLDIEEQMMYYDRDDLTRYSLGQRVGGSTFPRIGSERLASNPFDYR